MPLNCGQNMLPDHEKAKDYIYVTVIFLKRFII